MIEGITITPLRQIKGIKGDIFHALKSTDDSYRGFGEAYFSEIKSGQTKGWKRHNLITLNIIVVKGSIKFVIYDDRLHSKTKGQFQEIILSPLNNYSRLTLDPGLWMAFHGEGPEDSLLLDIIPQPHDPSEADTRELSEIPYNFN